MVNGAILARSLYKWHTRGCFFLILYRCLVWKDPHGWLTYLSLIWLEGWALTICIASCWSSAGFYFACGSSSFHSEMWYNNALHVLILPLAHELWAWLLHYCPVVMHGVLPDDYYQHHLLLAEGIYLLLKDVVEECDILQSSRLLSHYCYLFPTMYGKGNPF